MSREKKNNKKKNGGKILFLLIVIILAVAAILIFTKGGFGFGSGSGEGVPAGGTIPSMSETPAAPETESEVSEDNVTTADAGEEGQQGSRVVIEVSEDTIFADGTQCADTAALKEHLLGAAGESVEFVLRDNHAVKSVYDEAKSVLDELGYEYSSETAE